MSLRESLASGQLHGYRQDLFGMLSKRWVFVALTVVPALAVFGFVNMFPMLWALAASFFEVGAFQPSWTWAGIENFETVLANSDFWASIRRSVIFAAGSVVLQVTTGTALAILLDRKFSFKRVIRAIALVPYIVPTAVLSFVALWMGNARYGIINQLLVEVGLISEFIAWYGTTDLAMLSVIVTSSWKFTIFVTIIVLARLQSIPASIYEAATVSGASRWDRFKDITLPNLKGVLFIVVLLRGVWMFNKFDIIFILTNGGPINTTTTASIYAYRTAFSDFNLGEAAAVSTLLFVLLVGAAIVYFYFFEPSQEVRVE
ncbi:carbohydrate ABC transporter permease [Halobellus clavatus]|jgi:multiple sugar transport system permease protein|uniref:Multiple sugar transport system permease protein n=1 Tax=Halobellus clavatus TaxID=660517 RepID=A0A1H3DEG5_9EURY|nr:sugar ABC transporter permease [Halobellus clavatus]SDX64074.1 multiple sugar transport system permease protein [Halobellus clavatus]